MPERYTDPAGAAAVPSPADQHSWYDDFAGPPPEAASFVGASPHPSWLLTLVAAVQEYEDVHGHPNDGWECLDAAMKGVPPEVIAEARGYARAKRESG